MSLGASARSFWAWLNQKTVAPWVLALLGAVYAAGAVNAMVDAQAQQVTTIKAETAASIAEIKADVQRDRDVLHTDLIERLDAIKASQLRTDNKLDAVKDQVRDLRTDVSVVCEKVSGRCLHQ